jgi:hypothetical protein
MDVFRTAILGCAIILGAAVIAGALAISLRYETTITSAEFGKSGPTIRQWDRWTGEIAICQGETSEVRLDQPGSLELARQRWEKTEDDQLKVELGKVGDVDMEIARFRKRVKDLRNGEDRRQAWEEQRRQQRAAQGLPSEQEPKPQYETRHLLNCTTFTRPY